jgi:hypothetical protein
MPSKLLEKKLAPKHQEVLWSHGSRMTVDNTKWSECLLHVNVGKMDEHPSIGPDKTPVSGNILYSHWERSLEDQLLPGDHFRDCHNAEL